MGLEIEKERLANKGTAPNRETVNHFIGEESINRLSLFEKILQEEYDLTCELKFPFGKSYGWAYRYTHKKTLLLYVFFEKNGFCCTLSINDNGAENVAKIISTMLPRTKELWQNRYPCGKEGGWVHYSVVNNEELKDIIRLVSCKVKPKK